MTSPAAIPPAPDRAKTAPIIVPRLASNQVLISIEAPMVVQMPNIRPLAKPSTASSSTFGTNATAPTVRAIQAPPPTIAARTPIARYSGGPMNVIAITPDSAIIEL